MSVLPVFPTLLYTKTIDIDWNRDQVLARLDQYFDHQLATGEIVRNLHKEEVFKPLVDYFNQTVAEYWKVLEYDPGYPIELNQLWANRYNNSATYPHNLENDSPSIVTVVFYVDKDSAEQGNLFFANPLELLLQTQPMSAARRYRDRYEEFDGRTGDLVCFPSWLQHGIKPNATTRPRISMAGNYELKGLDAMKRLMSKTK